MWKNHKLDDIKQKGVSEKTGFPNAGTDTSLSSLDLGKLLIQNPSSTFFMRLRGNTWENRGVYDGDVAVIDRALFPLPADLVIWWGGESFALGKSSDVPEEIEIWGVVTNIIHQLRKRS